MSIEQLRMWLAFMRLEPFGEDRADFRAGTIAATIANVHCDTSQRAPFQPSDFFKLGLGNDDGEPERSKATTDPEEWSKMLGRFRVIYSREGKTGNP